MIKLSKISKVYRNDGVETLALSDITFEVKKGEFVAIMGPSGSGKSTLMHIIGALDSPTSGRYFLDGQDIATLHNDELAEIRNRKIGFVFQSFNLLPRTSVLKNVMLPMAYAGISLEERLQTARKFIDLVGLTDRIDHLSNQLSGGQQQRVAIARSLVMDPKIILADEPTGNIASDQAESIMKMFKDLNRQGRTIVMITHEPDIAAHAQRVIHLRDGKIIRSPLSSKGVPVGRGILWSFLK